MADAHVADVSKSLVMMSALERAHETRAALLLFSFVVFLDSAMIRAGGSGVYGLYSGQQPLGVNLILEFALIFVAYSLFMSLAMPIVGEFMRQIIILLLHSIHFHLTYDEGRMETIWRNGYVRPCEVRRVAHTTKDEYYLELAKEAMEREKTEREQRFRMLFLAMSCFALSAYNLLADRPGGKSLLQHLERAIPEGGLVVMLGFCGIFLFLAVHLTLGNHDTWVFCPDLANGHLNEKRKNEESLRRLREEARNYKGENG
jgi:hypothetical protein